MNKCKFTFMIGLDKARFQRKVSPQALNNCLRFCQWSCSAKRIQSDNETRQANKAIVVGRGTTMKIRKPFVTDFPLAEGSNVVFGTSIF